MVKYIIVAKSQNGVIGKDNQLLWHISEDLRRFKNLTMGSSIIMGRKTYESIGKPLPGRTNIVITRGEINDEGIITAHSLKEAYEIAEKIEDSPEGSGEVYVIGGASIYKQALEDDDIDYIYMTLIYKDFEGDVTFPGLDIYKWELIDEGDIRKDEKSGLRYSFNKFIRVYEDIDECAYPEDYQ